MFIRAVLYTFIVVTGACLLSPRTSAQYARKEIFVGPAWDTTSGRKQTAYVVGGGIEEVFGNHLGAGFELNTVIPGSGNANTTIGVASFNGYGHALRDSTWDPYITGGYSLIFRDFTANGWNAGAGLNYWFHENTAFTIELHEQAGKHSPSFAENHILELRFGISFR